MGSGLLEMSKAVSRVCFLVCVCLVGSLLAGFAGASESKSIAVVVYATGAGQNERAIASVAYSHLEQVLDDNGVTVLDQEKAQELKSSWKRLEDSSFVLTAEDVAKLTQKFKISGIYRVYIKAEAVTSSEQFFTATAQANIQFVNENFNVTTASSTPMGMVGNPSSDGLTASAAIANAVQRAVDNSLGKIGLKIDEAVVPCKLNIEFKPVDVAAVGLGNASTKMSRIPANPARLPRSFLRANVADATERYSDELACLAQSPDKVMVAAGVRVRTQFRMNLSWHSTMRIFDVSENKRVLEFEVDKGLRHGTTQILDCMFINNWRYLVAITGNTLVMWDIARGSVISRIDLPDRSLKSASLAYYRTKAGWFLVVEENNAKLFAFQFVVKGKS